MFLRNAGAAALAAALLGASAAAQEEALIQGPGSTLTRAKCIICHEIGHTTRMRQNRERWDYILRNMKERGMPMTDQEFAIILDYLARFYNEGEPPPPEPDTLAGAQSGGDPMLKLLEANACTGCHTLDAKVVGPAFKAIAEKYRGDAGAAARLAAKIRGGGVGVWGQVPMPPNPGIAEADLRKVVEWVLARQ